ncbi:MAG: hypothetical protein ACLQPD_14095 [Desulfomonilaceae bacterium]
MKKFDPAIPRRMFWSDSVGGKSHCPQCHSRLENESHVFVMAVRDPHTSHALLVGNDAGYFCPRCPTVVLAKESFRDFAVMAFGNKREAQFTVLGIVDLAAVPEDMRSTPLGGDGNPIPLVKFIRKPVTDGEQQGMAKAEKKRRRGKKRKRS